MQIVVDADQKLPEGLAKLFKHAAEIALTKEGVSNAECEVSLSFADKEDIRILNMKYRGRDEPTDVLSFPMFDNANEVLKAAKVYSGEPLLLGDIVICSEIADQQAQEYGHGTEREYAYLFVHSFYHLLGYDHTDGGEGKRAMREAEEYVLEAIKEKQSTADKKRGVNA